MSPSKTEVHHPVFARIYERVSTAAEAKSEIREIRREMLAGLSGRVLEVGAGNGLNFPHYPESVTEVVALEPEGYLRSRATEAADRTNVPIRVLTGVAEHLPVENAEFDAAVASLVLCSVREPARAIGELFRVVRPGGELRFHEHVRSAKPGIARFQRVIDVAWPLFAGGCHVSRDTGSAIRDAGFIVESCREFPFHMSSLEPKKRHILGIARRP